MFSKLFDRRQSDDAPQRLFAGIVAQARHPLFYERLGAPDTLDGRFDMIVLHAVLLMRRLRRDGGAGRALAQAVFDVFFADMDRSLREMGVSDFGVPKRIKKMAQAFYGRAGAYDPALDRGDPVALGEAIARNVHGGAGTEDAARALATYALESERALAGVPTARLTAGELTWPVGVPDIVFQERA